MWFVNLRFSNAFDFPDPVRRFLQFKSVRQEAFSSSWVVSRIWQTFMFFFWVHLLFERLWEHGSCCSEYPMLGEFFLSSTCSISLTLEHSLPYIGCCPASWLICVRIFGKKSSFLSTTALWELVQKPRRKFFYCASLWAGIQTLDTILDSLEDSTNLWLPVVFVVVFCSSLNFLTTINDQSRCRLEFFTQFTVMHQMTMHLYAPSPHSWNLDETLYIKKHAKKTWQ